MPSPAESREILLALAMGLALAATCGFRIFLPLLMLGLGLKFGWVPATWMRPEFGNMLSSAPVLLALSFATLLEVLSSKIPGLDHLLDLVGAPMAIAAGTALSSNSLIHIDDPVLRYALGFIAGGGAAGVIHVGNAALRLLSSKTTATLTNPFLSMFESLFAGGFSLLSIFIPVLALVILGVVMLAAFLLLFRWLRKRQVNEVGQNAHSA